MFKKRFDVALPARFAAEPISAEDDNLERTSSIVREYLTELVAVFRRYRFVYSFHAVDYLLKVSVPPSQLSEYPLLYAEEPLSASVYHKDWLDSMDSASDMDLVAAVSHGQTPDNWPASLRAYVDTIHSITIPRFPADTVKPTPCHHSLAVGMSAKKRHEVGRMTADFHRVLGQTPTSVVDFGAGQGYLSATLAYQLGYRVMAVDHCDIQTCGTLAKISRLKQFFPEMSSNLTVHSLKVAKDVNVLECLGAGNDSNVAICGLHSCGDLLPLMIKAFLDDSKSIRGLFGVGCCFNNVSESEGYTMSEFLSVQENQIDIGANGMTLACQSIYKWRQTSLKNISSLFEKQLYRLILQCILVAKDFIKRDVAIVLGRIKGAITCFKSYIRFALARLSENGQISKDANSLLSDEEIDRFYDAYKCKRQNVAAMWSFRILISTLIESILTMDRFIFILEQAKARSLPIEFASVFPLFDPCISPRNLAIVVKLASNKQPLS